MSAAGAPNRPHPIRLTGRSQIEDVVVGVVRAAMDQQIGGRVAELHLARPGHPGRRVEVREGQTFEVGDLTLRVPAIHPYNGRSPAGIDLAEIADGSAVGARLG